MEKSNYLEKSKAYKGFHYSVMDPDMMEYLHRRTLEMMKCVVSIFNENNIRYMVCGGTLLGAVNGGHFIPWDDDVDLCVPEEDYDRAMDCLLRDLDGEMELQCFETDPNYYLGWNKVRDTVSHCYPDAPKFKRNGVWIDIYKLIKTEKTKVLYLSAEEDIEYLKRRLKVRGITPGEYEERIRNGRLYEKLKNARKFIQDSTEADSSVYMIWSASKIAINAEGILPLKTVNFEGMDVTTFGNYEEYLKSHYGDTFMEFPPEEDRRIGINRIELDDNRDKAIPAIGR